MPRIRTLKPEFWADEKLGPLDTATRLTFLGLISLADDAGRLVDSVKALDGHLFPYTDDSCADALVTLAQLGRIIRYRSASGQCLIQITNWTAHQKIDHPSARVLPAPPSRKTIQDAASDAPTKDSRESRETVARPSPAHAGAPQSVPEDRPVTLPLLRRTVVAGDAPAGEHEGCPGHNNQDPREILARSSRDPRETLAPDLGSRTKDLGSRIKEKSAPPLPPKGGSVRSTSDPPGFAEFWSDWPVKRGRTPAVKAFRQLGAADQAAATQRLRDYLARRTTTEQAGGWVPSLPNPATWLNQARWQDEFPVQPRASPTEGRTNSQPGGWGDWANGKYPTLAELRAFQSRGGPGVISTREDLIARHGADAVARWDAMDATPEDPPEKSDDSTRNYLARRAAEEPVTREGMIAKYGAGDGHARWDAIQNAVQNAMAGDPSEEPSDSTRSN